MLKGIFVTYEIQLLCGKRCGLWQSTGRQLAISVGGLQFDSRASRIGHSVATAATFLRSCVVQALSCVGGAHHALRASG